MKGAYQAIYKRTKLERYYVIKHTSPNPERDGKIRQLHIESQHKGKKGQGTGSYRAPSIPPPETKQGIGLRTQQLDIEDRLLGIEDRLRGIEPRLLGIGNRALEEGTPDGEHWFGDKEEGEKFYITPNGFSSVIYKAGEPNGSYGQWERDGTPAGFHGNHFNGRKHGECIQIGSSSDSFYVTTYEDGVASGAYGQWKDDGSATGLHGNKAAGKDQGMRIQVGNDNLYIDTYEDGVASGACDKWEKEGENTYVPSD